MAILQSNMGEEIINGVSEVLKELYGVLELMTVYISLSQNSVLSFNPLVLLTRHVNW